MKAIAEVIDEIFERHCLPRRVEVLRDVGPIRAGSVLTWSDADRCYMHPSGRWVVWALTVRQGWGTEFTTARIVQTQTTFHFVAA